MWFNEDETCKDMTEFSDIIECYNTEDDSYRNNDNSENDNELEEDNVFTQFFIDNIMGGF